MRQWSKYKTRNFVR